MADPEPCVICSTDLTVWRMWKLPFIPAGLPMILSKCLERMREGKNMTEGNVMEEEMAKEKRDGWQEEEDFPQGGGLEALQQWEPGLDIEKALEFCDRSQEFYLELLRNFGNDNRQKQLTKFYEERDWKNYTIVVHTLKGVSRTLGFEDLGDVAEILQKASEVEDVDTIQLNHQRMMEKYQHILYGIKRM